MDVRRIVEWLVEGVPGARSAPEVLVRVCTDLRAAGLPLDRAEAFVRTLHPHIVGRSFVWRVDAPIEVREDSYGYLQSPEFLASPLAQVISTGAYVRRRASEPAPEGEQAFLSELAAEGVVDFVAAPLVFLSRQVHAVTLATRRPGGFDDDHIDAIRAIVPPLSRIAEILALSRTAANLLDTYVGRDAGERILAGHIQRGDVDAINAVMWLSDLRDFTSLAAELGPGETIAMLNELFECQVPAIESHGGEVLKFMGDGLLAIFPIVEHGPDASELCDTALDAVGEAFASLASLNLRRAKRGARPLRFGLSLHVGEVAYGNIGGASRLDFTCIGPAVNLAARLEGLTGRLGRDVVVSERFAELSTRPHEFVGRFELKGVAGVQEVYAPRGEDD